MGVEDVIIGIAVMGVVFLIFGIPILWLATETEVEFTVKEKWIKASSKYGQDYLIGSEEGEVFENTDALLKLKFHSSDIWNEIEEGKRYKAKIIGWRIPFLSWYRNILEVEEIE